MMGAILKPSHGVIGLRLVEVSVMAGTHSVMLVPHSFVHLSQSTIESVLAVTGNVPVDLSLARVSRLQALRNVALVPTIVRRIDLVVVAPPARIDHWVKRGGPRTFLLGLVRVLNLEACLGAISWDAARNIFRAISSPRRWRLFNDAHSCVILGSLMRLFVRCRSIRGQDASCLRRWVWQWLGLKLHLQAVFALRIGVLLTAALICTAGRSV